MAVHAQAHEEHIMGDAIGVDGCRGGWLAISGDGREVNYQVFATMAELLAAHREASRIFIDIPIGLPWAGCPVRPCDALAREKLGHRHVCVFPAPSRAACHAVRAGKNADTARQLNLSAIGKSLSAQALGICSKVAEVDELLLTNTQARRRVREVHPEVCFWALNRRMPLDAAKTSRAGIEDRLQLLGRRQPVARGLLEHVLENERRSVVKADDVLDAFAAYLVASAAPLELCSLAGNPDVDNEGLAMEMVYVD